MREKNPSYVLNENIDYKLVITSDGEEVDCNVMSASFRYEKGSFSNLFCVYPIVSATLTTDYAFFEGQSLTFSYSSDTKSGTIGTFKIVSVGETGTDFKTYQLESPSNNDSKCVKLSKTGFERYFQRKSLDYANRAAGSGSIMQALGFGEYESSYDFQMVYDPVFNKFYDYTESDVYSIWRATNIQDSMTDLKEPSAKITLDSVKGNNGMSSTGFERKGIDFYGITFTYIVYDASVGSYDGTITYNEYLTELYKTETATEYFYLTSASGNTVTSSSTKPTGNGIVVEFPFVVGELANQNNKTAFINYIKGSLLGNFLYNMKLVDLTPRSLKIPFAPEFFDTGTGVKSYAFYDFDFYSKYGDSDEYVDMTTEQYREYSNSRKYIFPAFVTTLNYNGNFELELSTGEQFEGGSTTSVSASQINITTSNGSVNIDSLYSTVGNLQKELSEMQTNFLSKDEFGQTISTFFDVAKMDGKVVKLHSLSADQISVDDLSAISANLGTITGGSIDIGNGTFKVGTDGRVDASNLHITGGDIDVTSDVENDSVVTASYVDENGKKTYESQMSASGFNKFSYNEDGKISKVTNYNDGFTSTSYKYTEDGTRYVDAFISNQQILINSFMAYELEVLRNYKETQRSSAIDGTRLTISSMDSDREVADGVDQTIINGGSIKLKNDEQNGYTKATSKSFYVKSDDGYFSDLRYDGLHIQNDEYDVLAKITSEEVLSPIVRATEAISSPKIYEDGELLSEKYATKDSITTYTYDGSTKTLHIGGSTVSYDSSTKTLHL